MTELAVYTPGLPAQAEAVQRYQMAGFSDATKRAYRADVRIFTDWCAQQGHSALPATPATVAAFIADAADAGTKPSTIRRRLAAIKFAHEAANLVPPTGHKDVQATARGIRREKGSAPAKKKAATAGIVKEMVRLCPNTLAGKRDRALLLLGFAGAFRRSELVALTVADLELVNEGMNVTIRRSKTDQEGDGCVLAVPHGEVFCPVKAVQDWLNAAEISEGPVFRRVRKNGVAGSEALTDKSVCDLVKQYANKAKLDADDFGAHSLRAGFLTSAAEAGASVFKMAEVSRHKSTDVLAGYIRSADRFKSHAGRGLL